MNKQEMEALAGLLKAGELSIDQFVGKLSHPGIADVGIADVGDAQVDLDRHRRCGFPEVVFSQGKTVGAIEKIFHTLVESRADVLATRMSPEQAAELKKRFPDGQYNTAGRTFRIPLATADRPAESGRVTIITAGTSDLPVAEEARETALWAGADVNLLQDVGVAGPHRLRANLHLLEGADAIIVVAGMEGALPSVVGGYVAVPIVAVPTSIGYGASFGGVAALLGMLNSCASNVTVVNIDAGFKGGYVAGLIALNAAKARSGNGA
ncbi:MAG: nickel pincer cofactor biosynthesis protein LarB [Thermoguttaceae bacterium]